MFPSTQDYKIALMIGADSFRTLQEVEVVMNPNYPTEPWFSTGGLAIVFKILVAGKPHALKCFYKDAPERQERLGHIASYLQNNPADYFVNFEYLDGELWVETNGHGQGYAVVLMEWVAGKTLDNYLEHTCRTNQTTELQTLYYRFCSLAWWLHQEPFAHGDLKHDNIIVTPEGNIKLIDYDGMYVPALSGRRATEQGSPCYQHPKRNAQHFDAQLDDFSLLVLQMTLLALWKKPALFAEHYNGDGILLKDTDYQNFDHAPVRQIIRQITEPKLPILLGQLSVCTAAEAPKIDLLSLIEDRDWISFLVGGVFSTTNTLTTEQAKIKAWVCGDKRFQELFICLISRCHPLPSSLLGKYKDKWKWSILSRHSGLPWSIELIEKFQDRWHWGADGLSENVGLPWSVELIEKYEGKWSWNSFGLSKNKSLPWSLELIEKYKDRWDWWRLSEKTDLPWSMELIEKYEDRWIWFSLSENIGLLWSINLLEKYEDRWGWWHLSENINLPWSTELIEKYEDRWWWPALSENLSLPWSTELLKKYQDRWSWHGLAENKMLSELLGLFNNYKFRWEWDLLSKNKVLPWSMDLIEEHKAFWRWDWLAANKSLPWSMELLNKYPTKWDKRLLSKNESLPWSVVLTELIEKYPYQWAWDSLSVNRALPWSMELIEKFEDRWDWGNLGLSLNPKLPWSIELIDKYEDKWGWVHLKDNVTVYEKIFKPYLTDEFIDDIMSEILKQEQSA